MTTTVAKDKTLNSLERTTLRNAEKTIQTHLSTFVDVGNALAVIRDQQLYRESHKTFEAYLKEKWDFQKSYAYRLIAAKEAVENVAHGRQTRPSLPENLPKPTSERQVRPLTELPAEEQPKAWAAAVEKAEELGKPVTAAIVEEVVEEMKSDTVVFSPSSNGHRKSGTTVSMSPSEQAKKQIQCWYETINRWLGQPVSIDDVRKLAPGKQGDNAVALASKFYEALKIWHSSIK